MADVSPPAAFTAEDLVAIAYAEGLAASERLIRGWVQSGLLDRPVVRGLGRARGVVGTWSESQMHLFVVLLRARKSGVHVANLCRLPVWLWLRWGDEAVPLRQVRRALATWAKFVTNPSWSESEKGARTVVAKVAAPGTKRATRKRLFVVIAEQTGSAFDRDALLEASRDVIDGSLQKARGPEGARLTAGTYTDLVSSRFTALDRLSAVTDDQYREARRVYREVRVSYGIEQPRFAEDPDIGHLFEHPSAEEEMNAACIDLVTTLGVVLSPPTKGATPRNA